MAGGWERAWGCGCRPPCFVVTLSLYRCSRGPPAQYSDHLAVSARAHTLIRLLLFACLTSPNRTPCTCSVFRISASNGVDVARRLTLLGFCYSAEQLFERVEDTVLARGGEVWETQRQLKRCAAWWPKAVPHGTRSTRGLRCHYLLVRMVAACCWVAGVQVWTEEQAPAPPACAVPNQLHASSQPCRSGVHECLSMKVAIPYLFGVPPEFEHLKAGIKTGAQLGCLPAAVAPRAAVAARPPTGVYVPGATLRRPLPCTCRWRHHRPCGAALVHLLSACTLPSGACALPLPSAEGRQAAAPVQPHHDRAPLPTRFCASAGANHSSGRLYPAHLL